MDPVPSAGIALPRAGLSIYLCGRASSCPPPPCIPAFLPAAFQRPPHMRRAAPFLFSAHISSIVYTAAWRHLPESHHPSSQPLMLSVTASATVYATLCPSMPTLCASLATIAAAASIKSVLRLLIFFAPTQLPVPCPPWTSTPSSMRGQSSLPLHPSLLPLAQLRYYLPLPL